MSTKSGIETGIRRLTDQFVKDVKRVIDVHITAAVDSTPSKKTATTKKSARAAKTTTAPKTTPAVPKRTTEETPTIRQVTGGKFSATVNGKTYVASRKRDVMRAVRKNTTAQA